MNVLEDSRKFQNVLECSRILQNILEGAWMFWNVPECSSSFFLPFLFFTNAAVF